MNLQEQKNKLLKKGLKQIESSVKEQKKQLLKNINSLVRGYKKQLKEIKQNKWTFYILKNPTVSIAFRTKSQELGYVNESFSDSEYDTLDFIFHIIGLTNFGEYLEGTYLIERKDVRAWRKQLIGLGLLEGTPQW